MNKTIIVIWVVLAMMAAGCGKIRTCRCWSDVTVDIVDTALFASFYDYFDENEFRHLDIRESAVECSYWNTRDTVGTYMPEYGIRWHYIYECREK